RILEAWAAQPVVHALGDLAEAEVTAELRRRLPWPAKLGVTGEDAVEIALRTALLATGKPGIVAFDGAYHGTGLLALAATGLGGGLPLSAALFVRPELEQVWSLGVEDVYTHTHVGSPLACAGALVVLDEAPRLLDRVREAAARFDAVGWGGAGFLRVREGDW